MPQIDFSTIQINARFFSQSGKTDKALALVLQFYNAETNTWPNLYTALNTEKGLLNKAIKLSSKTAAITLFKELIATGAIPPLRLVLEASLKGPTVLVVSEAPAMLYDAKTKSLTLEFGNNFAQSADTVKTYLQNETLATAELYAATPNQSAGDTEQLKKGLEELAGQYEALKKELAAANKLAGAAAALEKENAKLATQLNTANEKLQAANLLAEEYKTALASIKKEMASKEATWAKMEKDMIKADAKAQQQLSEATLALQAMHESIAEKETLIRTATIGIEAQTAEVLQLKEQLTSMNDTIVRNTEAIQLLNQQVKERDLALQSKDKIIAEQTAINQKLEDQIREMSQTAEEYKPVAQPVSRVYASILDEFKKTNELNKDGAYRLSNISLNIKTFIEHDASGIRMQLVDANKLSSLPAAALSDFRVEIGEGGSSGVGSSRVPNLLGLTETAARKITSSMGLNLKPVYESKKDVPDGQAFKQSPATGDVNPNATITLVFSKHNL